MTTSKIANPASRPKIRKTQSNEYAGILARSRYRAAQRGIEFSLAPEDFYALVARANGRCMVSGVPFSTKYGEKKGQRKPFAPSLDRIKSSEGYHKDNVRLVCVIVNFALNEWGEAPFLDICSSVYAKYFSPEAEANINHLWADSEYVAARDFINDWGIPMRPSHLSQLASMTCTRLEIPIKQGRIRTYQRVDKTWSYSPVNLYPRSILERCVPETMEVRAAILQPTFTLA